MEDFKLKFMKFDPKIERYKKIAFDFIERRNLPIQFKFELKDIFLKNPNHFIQMYCGDYYED